tara:strand:- start:1931 stop:2875 length:945 start_codon:yes stop_codon:yes gene_type:complete
MELVFILIVAILLFSLTKSKLNINKDEVEPPLKYEVVNNTIHNNKENYNTKLEEVLDNISNGDKLILVDITDKWSVNKDTIDEELNDKIMFIIQQIIQSIGCISGTNYYAKSIENMYVMKDEDNNTRCILNTFIYDTNNYYTIKLVLDIVCIEEEVYINFIDLDESSNYNIVNNYDLKWDSHGILNNYSMFDQNVQEILDDYYGENYNVIGYTHLNKDTIDTSTNYTLNQLTKYYYPTGTPKVKESSLFCDKYTNGWTNASVPLKKEKCLRNNNSYESYPNIPINSPGSITQNPDDNSHTWLFNSDRGVIHSNN